MAKYIVDYIAHHQIDEAAQLMTKSFLELNDLWKTFNPTYDEIQVWMRKKLLYCIKDSFVMVNIQKKRIVGVCICLDMAEYVVPQVQSETQPKLFDILSKYGKILEESIYKRSWNKQECLYFSHAAIDLEEASKGLLLPFIIKMFEMSRDGRGWKQFYCRISNNKVFSAVKKLGAQQVAVLELQGEMSGKKMIMMRLNVVGRVFPQHPHVVKATQSKL